VEYKVPFSDHIQSKHELKHGETASVCCSNPLPSSSHRSIR